MADSILSTTKKALGIDEAYTVFDPDIKMAVNTVFGTLQQLGVGPTEGFSIDDKETEWADYLGGDKNLNQVKSYIYMRVRLMFDPPQTSYLITSLEKQCREIEWRLQVYKDPSLEEANDLLPSFPTP